MESNNKIMDKRYVEIKMNDAILDYEKEMLVGVDIPSLLPLNIVSTDGHDLLCFNTAGYKTIKEFEIANIESLCKIIKEFVKSIMVSEQYLLSGNKHFLDSDMVFIDTDSKDVKLIYGRNISSAAYFDHNTVVVEFLKNLTAGINDKVYLQIINNITAMIKKQNPRLRKIVIQIEEAERKWYCRNLMNEMPFVKPSQSNYQM